VRAADRNDEKRVGLDDEIGREIEIGWLRLALMTRVDRGEIGGLK
jgi:hypothetical protein